jgi:hypothetical protein
MAGSEQRPDDVEGHMPFRRQDTEATDEDQVGDDTQGHMPWRRQDTEATDEDQVAGDTEGHMPFRRQDTEGDLRGPGRRRHRGPHQEGALTDNGE